MYNGNIYSLHISMWQICRVEDILIGGTVKGSIIHFHRARTIVVSADGMLTASELGNKDSIISILFTQFSLIVLQEAISKISILLLVGVRA